MALSKIDVANMLTGEIPNANVATLGVAKGGTGLTSGTTNQFLKFTGSTTLASAADNQGGITETDQWRVSSGFNGSANPISSNWERNDSSGFSKIGTGMSESSGVFTFGATGIYLINWGFTAYSYGNARGINEKLEVTTNNSSYSEVSMCQTHINNVASITYINAGGSYIFDVTDTAQCKCRFEFVVTGDTTSYSGDSTYNENHHTFIRLGDT